MTARHYYRYDPDDPVAEVPNVLRWGYTGTQKAEEGEAGMYEIVVDDPDMTADFVGHRRWTIYEDESDDDNQVIVDGLTQSVRIAHTGGDITQPIGRVWVIEIADLNTLWTYRVMTGSDSQFDAQSDVERMTQLVNSSEFVTLPDQAFLFASSPVEMDELNGRGQTTGQIADQCAQQSGKNWYLFSRGAIGEFSADIGIWYGKDSLDDYESPIDLSNDPADLDMPAVNDGTATTYPIGKDTVLRRDYARQYSGAYGEYANGAKYVVNSATLDEITASGRDMTHPAPEVKTGAKMIARLNRQLADHATPDQVITTTITLPPNKVSQVRPGMRIFFKATHEPGYESGRYLRIMTASYKPIGNLYEVPLEMQGPGEPAAAPPDTADRYYLITGDDTHAPYLIGYDGVDLPGTGFIDAGTGISDTPEPNDLVYYYKTGGQGWHFYNWGAGGSHGGSFAYPLGSGVGNVLLIGPVAAGTMTVYTVELTADETYSIYEFAPHFDVDPDLPLTSGGAITGTVATGLPAGTDYSFTVPA